MSNPKSLIVESGCLSRMIKHVHKSYPNEGGGFLLGEEIGSALIVRHLVTAVDDEATKTSWQFGGASLERLLRIAKRRNLDVLGMFHSHPNPELYHGQSCQSHDDVRVQEACGFEASIIIGISDEDCMMQAWRRGYSAPMSFRVEHDGKRFWLSSYLKKYGFPK